MEELYLNYTSSLKFLNLKTLETSRKKISVKFARSSISDQDFRNLFLKKQRQTKWKQEI